MQTVKKRKRNFRWRWRFRYAIKHPRLQNRNLNLAPPPVSSPRLTKLNRRFLKPFLRGPPLPLCRGCGLCLTSNPLSRANCSSGRGMLSLFSSPSTRIGGRVHTGSDWNFPSQLCGKASRSDCRGVATGGPDGRRGVWADKERREAIDAS